MTSDAKTVNEYIDNLPEDRKEIILKLRNEIKDNLPDGFEECMQYGMIGYVVPLATYPAGYNGDSKMPLPFINLASQKNHVAVYHMGVYSDNALFEWFTSEYPKYSKRKLDMGKSCIRFKKFDDIPYKLIGELSTKITVQQWIDIYEFHFGKKKK